MRRARSVSALLVLNVSLATAIHYAPPRGAPHDSDRAAYDYVGLHGFEANCPWSIYCFRVLVPTVLHHIPIENDRRWRWFQFVGTAAAGTVTSLTMLSLSATFRGAVIAAVLTQTSYGFAFTAYDPYSPDPLVFAIAALIGWCWLADRWRPALMAGMIGVFAKETVALVSASCLLGALARERTTWRAWVGSSLAVCLTLAALHLVMSSYGWNMRNNPAAEFGHGSWLALWWRNNPFLIRKLYLLFVPFGFAWLFAALALPATDRRLRRLALGAVAPMLALCYIQTPERALSNAFFVIVPLATLFLMRAPFWLALAAAVANGAVTARVGSSSTWLPASSYLMIPATLLTTAVLYTVFRQAAFDWRSPARAVGRLQR
jgi:hypothetical protein